MFAYLESPLKHLLQHSHGTTPGKKVMSMSVVVILQLPLSAPLLLFGLFAVFSLFPKEKPSHNSHRSLVIWALCVKAQIRKTVLKNLKKNVQMCSCKGAQLCTLILKAEYGQMSFNAENTN